MSTQAFSFMGGAVRIMDSPPVEIAEVQKVTFSGNKVDFADVTNIQSPDNYKEFIPTLIEAGELSFDANFIPGDETQTDLYTARDARTKKSWEVVLPDSLGTFSFDAYVASIDQALDFAKEAKLTV